MDDSNVNMLVQFEAVDIILKSINNENYMDNCSYT